MRKIDQANGGARQKVKRPDVKVERAAAPKKKPIKLIPDLRPESQKRSPGPSKTMYRLTRIWKKSWVRRVALVGLPVALLAFVGWRVAHNPAVHAFVGDQVDRVVASLAERPEFAVRGAHISGASSQLQDRLETLVQVPDGASTLTFDVADLRLRLDDIAAVRSAQVQLDPKGILQIEIEERIAEALWRDASHGLWLVDREGVAIDPVEQRTDWPDLPVIIGPHAPEAMAEGLALFHAVPDLRPRIRAIVRVGARRWNVVLDRGLTIMLPEVAPKDALSRVMAWQYGDEALDRGLVAVDMRLPDRPTLRMNPKAHELLELRRKATDEGEET